MPDRLYSFLRQVVWKVPMTAVVQHLLTKGCSHPHQQRSGASSRGASCVDGNESLHLSAWCFCAIPRKVELVLVPPSWRRESSAFARRITHTYRTLLSLLTLADRHVAGHTIMWLKEALHRAVAICSTFVPLVICSNRRYCKAVLSRFSQLIRRVTAR